MISNEIYLNRPNSGDIRCRPSIWITSLDVTVQKRTLGSYPEHTQENVSKAIGLIFKKYLFVDMNTFFKNTNRNCRPF